MRRLSYVVTAEKKLAFSYGVLILFFFPYVLDRDSCKVEVNSYQCCTSKTKFKSR